MKKTYVRPAVDVITIQSVRMLAQSRTDNVSTNGLDDLEYDGDRQVTGMNADARESLFTNWEMW